MKLWSTLAPVSALVLVALAFSGCSASSEGSKEVVDGYDYSLGKGVTPDTGEAALMQNVGVKTPVLSNFFEKRYNSSMLQAVLRASDRETVKFVEASGTPVYKIPYAGTDSNVFLFQHFLAPAPTELHKRWTDAGGTDDAEAGVDGLFVGQAIMVRESSSRWTLVHEMTHLNFYLQRRDDRNTEAQVSAKSTAMLKRLTEAYAFYKANPARQDALVDAGSNALAAAKLVYQDLANNSLEEIAVESLLLQEWNAGRLKYVTNFAVRNAAWYIDYSRENSLQPLASLDSSLDQMRETALAANLLDTAKDFQAAIDFIVTINQRTAELALQAKDVAAKADDDDGGMLGGLMTARAQRVRENRFVSGMNNTPEAVRMRETLKALADAVHAATPVRARAN